MGSWHQFWYSFILYVFNSACAHDIKVFFNLQAENVRHHKVGEADEPAIYRINDDLVIFTCNVDMFPFIVGNKKHLKLTHFILIIEGILG